MDKELRIDIDGSDSWEGSLSEFEQANPEMPDFTRRLLHRLKVGETVRLNYPSQFKITRKS